MIIFGNPLADTGADIRYLAWPNHARVTKIKACRRRTGGLPVKWVRGAPGSLVGNGSPDRRGGAGGVRTVEIVVLLVAVATVVAALAKPLRVPAPSLLVAGGLMVGLMPGAPAVHVPPAVVSLVVLPPLLYAASEELPWRDLRAVWRPVAV